jgi:hypothetical protein
MKLWPDQPGRVGALELVFTISFVPQEVYDGGQNIMVEAFCIVGFLLAVKDFGVVFDFYVRLAMTQTCGLQHNSALFCNHFACFGSF